MSTNGIQVESIPEDQTQPGHCRRCQRCRRHHRYRRRRRCRRRKKTITKSWEVIVGGNLLQTKGLNTYQARNSKAYVHEVLSFFADEKKNEQNQTERRKRKRTRPSEANDASFSDFFIFHFFSNFFIFSLSSTRSPRPSFLLFPPSSSSLFSSSNAV